jgi:hypothetical protein
MARSGNFSNVVERIFQVTAGILALTFLASGILFLWNGHVTVTAFDMWHLYTVSLNQPFWRAALLKYGSHSMFFPTLLWSIDLAWFHSNQQLLFVTGLALLILSAIVLLVATWQDKTTGTTAKLVATLVVVVANFSMTRASITAIGPFNCICSLVVVGALTAFYALALICGGTRPYWILMVLVVTSGLIASFSFGSGFAVWPTLLILGWSARLSWRTLGLILAGGIVAVITYGVLPGAAPEITPENAISLGTALRRFCSLLGTPFLYATAAWSSPALSPAAAQSSNIPVVCGALGLGLAAGAVMPRLVRRDLGTSKLQFIALALTVFNFVAIGFIVIGRTAHMHASPGEVVAPRYMFWSLLFWAGLFLIFVQNVDSKKWARWPTFSVLSTLPLLIFPEHYQASAWGRQVHLMMESAATSLINGVCDTDMVAQMYPTPTTVYSLAKQYRQRRLDMFAGSLQDWIGVSETNLFGGHYESVRLKGSIAVQSLVRCEKDGPAARVTGWAIERETFIPKRLILVDHSGKVCGVARPTEIRTDINKQNRLPKFAASGFLGYIRDYSREEYYWARTADDNSLSKETLPVSPLELKKGSN